MKRVEQTSILVVEDHDLMRRALHDALQKSFPGCRILVAVTGETGIALAQIHRPQVVVMDLNLPQINGIEATRWIKKLLPTTAVIVCTSSDEPDDRVAAYKAGADVWVQKECAIDVLIPTVRSYLRMCLLRLQDAEDEEGVQPLLGVCAQCRRPRVA